MKQIRGITWDHPRGYDSIVAATEAFHRSVADVEIVWERRSLKDFGDLPISKLVDKFDLLMIDHPFVGEAHKEKLLLPLDDLMSVTFLETESRRHIGDCYNSYSFAGNQYALPVDAAAQFTAFDKNRINASDLPQDWNAFLEAKMDPAFQRRLLWPLSPTDLWCSFLTVAAQLGEIQNQQIFDEGGLNIDLATEALELLKQLTEGLPNVCWELNPIGALEMLNNDSEFGYSPLLFGYSNYGRNKSDSVEFANAVGFDSGRPTSLMGGVGISVSSRTKYVNEIASYLKFIMQEGIIGGLYFEAGGQPSLSLVWESETHNIDTSGFFRNTTTTMLNAYVRPRIPGFNGFQEKGSVLLHDQMLDSKSDEIVFKMNEIFRDSCG